MKKLIARTTNAALVTAVLALGAGRPAASDPLVTVNDWTGNWRGTYSCNQGTTGLFVSIKGSGSEDAAAVFKFFGVPENPDVPSGEFEMAGKPGPGNHLALFPMRWIMAPQGYLMVGLDGTFDESTGEYSGRVYGVGCSRFTLRRAAPGEKEPTTEKSPTREENEVGGKNSAAGENDGIERQELSGGKGRFGGKGPDGGEREPDGGEKSEMPRRRHR